MKSIMISRWGLVALFCGAVTSTALAYTFHSVVTNDQVTGLSMSTGAGPKPSGSVTALVSGTTETLVTSQDRKTAVGTPGALATYFYAMRSASTPNNIRFYYTADVNAHLNTITITNPANLADGTPVTVTWQLKATWVNATNTVTYTLTKL